MKTAVYKNENYILSFDGDVIFCRVEAHIRAISELAGKFEVLIKEIQLDPNEEKFSIYLVSLMNAEQLEQIRIILQGLVLTELVPQAYSIFYSSTEFIET